MLILLALLPLFVVLVSMMRLRLHTLYAGALGWGVALLVAAAAFGADAEMLLWSQLRGLMTALTILPIIWGALLFYRVTEAAGTIEALVARLRLLSPERPLLALLLAWGFAAFLQGVGGFGVPVAIVAPLMVALGYPPATAVLLPALGHSWAISFGSLGASFLALSGVVSLEGAALAAWCAADLAVVALLAGWAVWRLGGGSLRQVWFLWLPMGVVMGGVQWGAARLGLWNVAALLGAMAGLLTALLLLRRGGPAVGGEVPPPSRLLPYAILLALVFALRFVAPLRAVFDAVRIVVEVPSFTTARGWTMEGGPTRPLSLFGNTGALLLYASLITLGLGRRWGRIDRRRLRRLLADFRRGALLPGGGLVVMVLLAATMEGAGMIDLLARALATAADGLFAPLSPWLGALVAFVTGSNMASNLLLGALQSRMAALLDLRQGAVLAAQNAGAALGSVLSPAKLVVGCSTVGMAGREAEVMRGLVRRMLPWLLVLALWTWALAG